MINRNLAQRYMTLIVGVITFTFSLSAYLTPARADIILAADYAVKVPLQITDSLTIYSRSLDDGLAGLCIRGHCDQDRIYKYEK